MPWQVEIHDISGLLANAAAGVVRGATASSGFRHPDVIANAARTAVWVFAVIVAVNQIGVAQELVNTLFVGAVALAVLALGLWFGLGGRDLVGDLLRKWYGEGQANAGKLREAAERTGRGGDGGGGAPAHGLRDK